MNVVQKALVFVSNAFSQNPSDSMEVSVVTSPRLVKRRPRMIDRIVFLEESNSFDVHLCKMALDKMFRSSFFSICEVRECVKLLKLSQSYTTHTMERLHMIHCVHWSDMDPGLRELIPGMISEIMTEGAYSENPDLVVSNQ